MAPTGQQQQQVLQNSYPYTIYPTFSSLLTEHHISPSMNSLPHQTDFGTCPLSSLTPRFPKVTELCSILRCVFSIHPSCLDPFRSSSGPSVRRSPFHISYAFLFRFCSCSASATQHRPSIPFPLSISYDSLSPFFIGSAMW